MVKSFKQYITEASEVDSVNKILQRYINGSMPDPYDNEQDNVKNIIQQLYDIFKDNNINITILNAKGKEFDGSNIVINTDKSMHFQLANAEGQEVPYMLHLELKQKDDGYYFFSTVKVEPK